MKIVRIIAKRKNSVHFKAIKQNDLKAKGELFQQELSNREQTERLNHPENSLFSLNYKLIYLSFKLWQHLEKMLFLKYNHII